ncbi:hypothetical protein SAMN02745124_02934 [Desulfofustis glycolicus DSM 9705]|uniref:Uncharacterized protein n=1 Tax=Desulfofustis glycolicus DSM 9705 TaxID=1121409 RepID=A0A1M5XBQ0_9BACT|nr:hypothetical protein SAMN02745124_02934 [Desulfofustis glycolicus DSM 9705]
MQVFVLVANVGHERVLGCFLHTWTFRAREAVAPVLRSLFMALKKYDEIDTPHSEDT